MCQRKDDQWLGCLVKVSLCFLTVSKEWLRVCLCRYLLYRKCRGKMVKMRNTIKCCWNECVGVWLKSGVGANNAGSVTLNFTHKAKMPRTCVCMCVCVCVWSANINTVANLCFYTPELLTEGVWTSGDHVIAPTTLCPSFCVSSSAHWFTFHHLKVSNYFVWDPVTPLYGCSGSFTKRGRSLKVIRLDCFSLQRTCLN